MSWLKKIKDMLILFIDEKPKPQITIPEIVPQNNQIKTLVTLFHPVNFKINFYLTEHSLIADEIDFIGRYNKSPNGKYIITWDEEKKKDNVFLITGGYIIISATIPRPESGAVSNIGTFVITSSKTNSANKFYAVKNSGYIQLEETFLANAGGVGISPDGKYAVFQTLESKNQNQSNMLYLYNLDSKRLVNCFKREVEGSYGCLIYPETQEIHLVYNNPYREYSLLRYTFDGTFIDHYITEKDFFKRATGYALSTRADQLIANTSSNNIDDYNLALLYLNTALERGVSEGTAAHIYKSLGEIHFKCNNIKKAVEYWEKAILLRPRIGLKQKVAKLKKLLPVS